MARPAAPRRSPSIWSLSSVGYSIAMQLSGFWLTRARLPGGLRCVDACRAAEIVQPSLSDAGFLATIFARRHIEFGAEHASKVGRTVEPIIERNRGDGASSLCSRLQGARTRLEPAPQDVARDGLLLIREQVVQIARGHLAGLGDARRRQIRIIQMRFDEIDDADAMRGAERGPVGQRLRKIRISGADEIENGHRDTAAGLLVQPLVVLAPVLAQQLGQKTAGAADAGHRNGGQALGATDLTPQRRVGYAQDQHAVRAGEYHFIAARAVAEREITNLQYGFAPVLTADALALELQVQKEHRIFCARHMRA